MHPWCSWSKHNPSIFTIQSLNFLYPFSFSPSFFKVNQVPLSLSRLLDWIYGFTGLSMGRVKVRLGRIVKSGSGVIEVWQVVEEIRSLNGVPRGLFLSIFLKEWREFYRIEWEKIGKGVKILLYAWLMWIGIWGERERVGERQ